MIDGKPKTISEAMTQGLEWIVGGGNYMGFATVIDGIEIEFIVKRKGFVPPGGAVEEIAKDRIYTLEGFHCALKTAGIQEIDGPPMAYMEFPVDVERMVSTGGSDISIEAERHIQRWQYVTLKSMSHLPDPVARVELLTDLFKVIKSATSQIKDTCMPMVVWRSRPEFSADTDQGITKLRCRLYIPGVDMEGVRWVEGQ